MEIWKYIQGTDGAYSVSNQGRIYSHRSNKILSVKKSVYLSVTISINGVRKTVYVHSLVAVHFLGERPNGQQVNHIDGNKHNCRSENLEYVSRLENMIHSKKHINQHLFTSQKTGVGFYPKTGKWRARLFNVHLGYFDTEEAAYIARCEAEKRLQINNRYL